MEAVASLKPGLMLGHYPQKQENQLGHWERRIVRSLRQLKNGVLQKKYTPHYIVTKVNRHADLLAGLSERALSDQIGQLRTDLTRDGLQARLIERSFALIREVSYRVLGKRHFDVQLLGGWIMINGMVAEMETGQGKTLTATLASCTAALAGIPVHVITTNDYLASRDAELLKPLYERLGLSVGFLVDGMSTDARRKTYASDIVHASNKQLAFDYLRDRLEMGGDNQKSRLKFKQIHDEQQGRSKLLMRGLCYAIVDEADSVLIDEARTPLILSRECPNVEQEQLYQQAMDMVAKLNKQHDFVLNLHEQRVELTDAGAAQIADLSSNLSGFWKGRKRRELLIKQALSANYLFERGKQYLVHEGRVQIVDENTGRLMSDRSWEQGLHQLIEVKESCKITAPKESLARISYQRFFRRYLRLSGMSGTVKEVADELGQVYGLNVISVPTHTPSKRMIAPDRVFATAEQKHRALIDRIQHVHGQGRPILIGTCSISASEALSLLLTRHHLPHQVLTAQQDQQEAEIISNAGHRGSIIIATNIAGRGTDIELGPGVGELGGLHVIVTERNNAYRIDRQLHGRTARQGDPGSVETFLSLEDRNMMLYYSTFMLQLFSKLATANGGLPYQLGRYISLYPQRKLEKQHRSIRAKLLKMDEQLRRRFAFTGQIE